MPEPESSNVDVDVSDNDSKADEKGGELTLESLAEMIKADKTTQNELIETLKAEGVSNASSLAQLMQTVQDRDGDIAHLTNLLGNLAGDDDGKPSEEDLSTAELVDKRMADNKQSEKDESDKENKKYNKVYVATVLEELDDELAPDGKPFNPEARKGILDIVKTDKDGVLTDNAIRDGHKNFKRAVKIYYGLDKTHGFKGASIEGTGGGTGESKEDGKKTYTLTKEAKEELKEMGETEKWGIEVLEKRDKEKAAAY